MDKSEVPRFFGLPCSSVLHWLTWKKVNKKS